MMSWLLKLIGGWLPIGTKPFPEWAGKIIWAVVICVCVNFAITHFFPTKNVTTIQPGATQIINQGEKRDMMGFGCNVFRLYIKAGVK